MKSIRDSLRTRVGEGAQLVLAFCLSIALGACAPSITAHDVESKTGGKCESTGFLLTNRISGDKREIFSCDVPNKGLRCVTMSGGIASDETNAVSIVFEDSFGEKPTCYKKNALLDDLLHDFLK